MSAPANLCEIEKLALRYLRLDRLVCFDGARGPETVAALAARGLAIMSGDRPGEARLTIAGERMQAAIQDEMRRAAQRRAEGPCP